MTTSTLTLTSFLLARIAEDEAGVRDWAIGGRGEDTKGFRESEAKRRIVEDYLDERSRVPLSLGTLSGFECALEHLACVYADHPDFNPDWQA